MAIQLSLFPPDPKSDTLIVVRIEFDGGTPCNIPSRGYGDGYGSFRIDKRPVERVQFKRPMSANAAEIWTLHRALISLPALNVVPKRTSLLIGGDSKIALKWTDVAAGNRKSAPPKSGSGEFLDAINALKLALPHYAEVKTQWRGRAASVALFGH